MFGAPAPKSVLDRDGVKTNQAAITDLGDRKKEHKGLTKNGISKGSSKILYDAEMFPSQPFAVQVMNVCCCKCQAYDDERSYMYVREGALEINYATKANCCGMPVDDATIIYFDRPPFRGMPRGKCQKGQPKIELDHNGCLCCGKEMDPPCGPKYSVVNVPFTETACIPCCCFMIPNHTSKCDQLWMCYGFLGPVPVLGSPKIKSPFWIQPKDPATFVTVAQQAMERALNPGKASEASV